MSGKVEKIKISTINNFNENDIYDYIIVAVQNMPILVPIFSIVMNTKIAEFAMAKHTIVAKDEMNRLEKLFIEMVSKTEDNMPWFNSLN